MDMYLGMTFGRFIEEMRKERGISLRKTAELIGVSPQFYSEVEKERRSAFTPDRLETLRQVLGLTDELAHLMYDKAAESKKRGDMLPQDFPDYIAERDYVVAALRVAKELDAGEAEWQRFVDDLRKRELRKE